MSEATLSGQADLEQRMNICLVQLDTVLVGR